MNPEREKALIRELLAIAEEQLRTSQELSESAEVLKEASKRSKSSLEKGVFEAESRRQERLARQQFDHGQNLSARIQEILGETDG